MRLLSLFAVAMAGLIAMPAPAQTPPPDGTPTRVRGTVEKLDGHNLTVKSRDGQSLSITLAPDVDILTLVKKSLADIKPGDFVASTGIKDKDGKIHAIEARIFPKATPDGGRQFAWDLMPDSVMTARAYPRSDMVSQHSNHGLGSPVANDPAFQAFGCCFSRFRRVPFQPAKFKV